MAKDYYSILGLSKTASVEEIKKAYRKKALEFHPDKNREANAEERFKEIGEAYEILSDSDKRSMYDRCGQSGQRSPNTVPSDFSFKSTVDPFDLFRTFFGSKDPFADVFASVFKNGEFCQEPRRSASSHRSNFVSQHFLKVNRSRLGSDDPSAKTTVEEQIGEGGTVHITKTIIGGDGSVRREMRFRTQSDSRVMSDRSRFGDSDKNIDRQVSAPAGYVTTSSPIIIKKVDIKRETVENHPIKVKEAETATATATIQIHPPPSAKTARIKINVVKQATENKENLIKNTDDKNDNKIKILDNNSKIHTENKITLTLPLKT